MVVCLGEWLSSLNPLVERPWELPNLGPAIGKFDLLGIRLSWIGHIAEPRQEVERALATNIQL